jgi:hypothetical protein
LAPLRASRTDASSSREASSQSAEIYDPATGQFTAAGVMQEGRGRHCAILLTDGRALVLGGVWATTTTDIFDPTSGIWSPGPVLAPAPFATATLLQNGRVLIFGGEDAQGFPSATVMLFE